jgi:hypothetical protein
VGHFTDHFLKSVSRPVKIETALIVYYLEKKVDCLNFDICHRKEDLTMSSIVVL